MSEHRRYLPSKVDCKRWTLFLDRDGVINQYLPADYAKTKDDFILNNDVVEAIGELKRIFHRVVMVTNQQGIGKEVMSNADLENVHLKLFNSLKEKGISYFDSAFYAPYLKADKHHWRKPSTGMMLKSQEYFPEINFNESVVVGDSPGDMELAQKMGAIRVKIRNPEFDFDNQDYTYTNLKEFVDCMS